MSRLGKTPVAMVAGVKVSTQHGTIHVEGPKGKLQFPLHPGLDLKISDKAVIVEVKKGSGVTSAMHGTTRSTINNMIVGVAQGFKKNLTVVGIGWNAKLQGKNVVLQVGFCVPVELAPPEGVKVEVPQPQQIILSGPDKQKVGEFAALIRKARPPEPYNQKGVRYADEVVRKKAGKAFVGSSGA